MLERRMGRYIAICSALWLVQLGGLARAEQVPLQIALFKTTSTAADLSPLGAALDPVLQAELGHTPEVTVAAVPPLDLPSLQLALDCVGETPTCLAVAAERSKVTGLLSPTLARAGAALIVSLLLYDPQQSQSMQVVTRSFAGNASDAVVIEGAKAMVHELFGHKAEPPPPAAEPAPEPPPQAAESEQAPGSANVEEPLPPLPVDTQRPSLLLPVALGAGGVAAILVGVGFGIASNNSEARYGQTRILDNADAQHASQLYERAQTQAVIANVALVLGVASCVAGGVVYFLQRSQRPDAEPERGPSARLAIGPGYVGVAGGF